MYNFKQKVISSKITKLFADENFTLNMHSYITFYMTAVMMTSKVAFPNLGKFLDFKK